MNRIIVMCLLVWMLVPCVLLAGETGDGEGGDTFNLDLGGGVSTVITGGDDPWEGFINSIIGLRGVCYTDFRYNLNSGFSLGTEVGIAGMTLTLDNGERRIVFLDIPVRAVARLGGKENFLQAYTGVYMPVSPAFGVLFDLGLRASLGNMFLEGSFLRGRGNYFRMTVGYFWNELAGF